MAAKSKAAPEAAKQPAKVPGAKGKKTPLAFWVLGVGTGILLGVALPTGLLLGIGLLPAAIGLIGDQAPSRPTARTVLAMNLAGLAPAVKTLWLTGHDLTALMVILGSLEGLPLAYTAAVFGYATAKAIPWTVLLVLEAKAAEKRRVLELQREALKAEWGAAIMGGRK